MKEYLIIYEQGPTSWGAYAPDLPGCVAVAETRAEVADLMREAIAFHIEGLRLSGDPVPEPVSEAERLPVAA
jgi:predicted RNase H-like HicB family nuclease